MKGGQVGSRQEQGCDSGGWGGGFLKDLKKSCCPSPQKFSCGMLRNHTEEKTQSGSLP